MSDSQTLTRSKIEETTPNDYKVVFHNDDVTPFLFVVVMLVEVFDKNIEDAEKIAKSIHETGRGIAGSYIFDVAEQKQLEVMTRAAEFAFPLMVTLEPMG
jgi:ATP-dependent Clp protease adaptor protein ClpS